MCSSFAHTAVVLGLSETGVAAVRSLGRVGIPVVGLDCDSQLPGFSSKYCTGRLCPDPVRQAPEALEFLLAEGERLRGQAVVFPTSDSFVLLLSRYRDELAGSYRFALPPVEVVEALVDKRRQYQLAEQVGIPTPRTFYPETVADVERVKDVIEYPAFVKPHYGHLWRMVYGGAHKGFKVRGPAELVARYAEIIPRGLQALVQEIVPGPNTNHFKVCAYLGRGGDLLAVFTLRKIRQYPTEFGVGTMVEGVRDPELVELGLQFMRGIHYRGIGSIEFKRDDRDGTLKMIELNPRLWQQNGLAADCGVNFPLIQYLDLCERRPVPRTGFRPGVCWLDAMADFQSFWSYHLQGKLSLLPWLRSISHARSFATFALDDLGPFFAANQHGMKYVKVPLYMARHRSHRELPT